MLPPNPTPATTANDPPAWATTLAESIAATNRNVDRLVEAAAAGRLNQQPRQEPDEPELEDAMLESLPRSRFAEHIANKTAKHIEKTVIAPLRQRLSEVTQSTTQEQLRNAVEVAKAKFPDLMDFKDEMIALSSQAAYSNLPPEDLYHLARQRNPSKVRKPATSPTDGDGASTKPRIKFGGLRPAAGDSGTGERNQKMAPGEALSSAWNETVATLGGEPDFDE
jgi:hypothetical protein